MILRFEINDLAPKIPGGGSPVVTKRLFNAALALIDADGEARPYLAESLPQINSADWRVSQDGRMETTYRLRAGLTWQDGHSLTADDFVFAFKVYMAPGLGIFIPTPQDKMESVTAPDERTIVVQWRALYPDAAVLKDTEFDPLPRHIMEAAFSAFELDPTTRDSFIARPFWANEYIGAGPYRLEKWDPGSQMEGRAFAGHALGRPKIERLLVRIMADENSVLTTVLAGNTDFTTDFTLRFEHALVLQREWEPAGKGKVILRRSGPVSNSVQLRPEYVMHPGQLDVRVRKALMHGIDRAALNDGVFASQGFVTENIVPEGVPYFSDVERAIDKYPYDARRVEQYMAEAGFSKDRDGFYASPSGDHFRSEFRAIAGPEFERGQAIMVDSWRRLGLDIASTILAANLVRDAEARHVYGGFATRGGGLDERTWTSAQVASAANRWVGENRTGWSDPEYDRLYEAFATTLDRAERTRQVVQMQHIISQNLPLQMLYQAIQVNTVVDGLKGPDPGTGGSGLLTPGTLPHWNVADWLFS